MAESDEEIIWLPLRIQSTLKRTFQGGSCYRYLALDSRFAQGLASSRSPLLFSITNPTSVTICFGRGSYRSLAEEGEMGEIAVMWRTSLHVAFTLLSASPAMLVLLTVLMVNQRSR